MLLGEPFPKDDVALEASVVEELGLTPHHLRDRTIDELLATPDLDSEESLAKLRILVGMWMTAYLVSKDNIVQWCSVKMANLTLRFGNSEFAAFAYVQYGYVCVRRLKRFEEGWRYGDLAIRLSERYANIEMRGKVYFNFALVVNHWTRHMRISTDIFRQAYMYSVEAGDWTYAVYGAANIISNLLIEGKPCEKIASEAKKYFDFLRPKAEVGLNSFFLPGGYVALLNLQGKTRSADTFNCEHLHEEKLLNGLGQLPIVEAWFYSVKLRSLFFTAIWTRRKRCATSPTLLPQAFRPRSRCLRCVSIVASRLQRFMKRNPILTHGGGFWNISTNTHRTCGRGRSIALDNFLHKHWCGSLLSLNEGFSAPRSALSLSGSR